jgi:hypothetical protein
MQEVAARDGKIILLSDPRGAHEAHVDSLFELKLPAMPAAVTPFRCSPSPIIPLPRWAKTSTAAQRCQVGHCGMIER